MQANEYQEACKDTAIYRDKFPMRIQTDETLDKWNGIAYCAMKLAGEAGELVQEIAKTQRDDGYVFTADRFEAIFDELGDVEWYVAMLCNEIGFRLSDVMDHNLAKLDSRKQRGKLGGSGSKR